MYTCGRERVEKIEQQFLFSSKAFLEQTVFPGFPFYILLPSACRLHKCEQRTTNSGSTECLEHITKKLCWLSLN